MRQGPGPRDSNLHGIRDAGEGSHDPTAVHGDVSCAGGGGGRRPLGGVRPRPGAADVPDAARRGAADARSVLRDRLVVRADRLPDVRYAGLARQHRQAPAGGRQELGHFSQRPHLHVPSARQHVLPQRPEGRRGGLEVVVRAHEQPGAEAAGRGLRRHRDSGLRRVRGGRARHRGHRRTGSAHPGHHAQPGPARGLPQPARLLCRRGRRPERHRAGRHQLVCDPGRRVGPVCVQGVGAQRPHHADELPEVLSGRAEDRGRGRTDRGRQQHAAVRVPVRPTRLRPGAARRLPADQHGPDAEAAAARLHARPGAVPRPQPARVPAVPGRPGAARLCDGDRQGEDRPDGLLRVLHAGERDRAARDPGLLSGVQGAAVRPRGGEEAPGRGGRHRASFRRCRSR